MSGWPVWLFGALVPAAFALMTWLVWRRWTALPLVLALVSVLSVIPAWNPVSFGAQSLTESELAKTVRRIDVNAEHELGRRPTWIVYDSIVFSNLLRMVGASSISGVHFVPQMGLWEVLDPIGTRAGIWNRYAHVQIERGQPGELELVSPQGDVVRVKLGGGHPAFEELGIDIVMTTNGEPFDLPGYEKFASDGTNHFYRKILP